MDKSYMKSQDYSPQIPIGSVGKMVKNSSYFEVNDVKNSRNFFDKNGYVVIKNLLDVTDLYEMPPNKRGRITYYENSLNLFNYQEETQVYGSFSRYSYPLYKHIHSQVRIKLEKILDKKLLNTYYFDRFYFSGQRLLRHIDRDACELSVSIQISTNSKNPWPLCIESKTGVETYSNMENGWGLIYLGCDRPHWRDELKTRHSKLPSLFNKICKKEDDTYHHQIFFHYVFSDGLRSHFAGDKR